MPSAKELAGTGLEPDDYARGQVEVWPDVWPAIDLLSMCATQWRTTMAGPCGLDYGVVMQLMDRQGLDREAQLAMLADLRVAERAALDEMTKTFD